MIEHPTHYTDLLRRRWADEMSLTVSEQCELDLHLLICPQCAYQHAQGLSYEDPEGANQLLRDMERTLTAERLTPFLRNLAQATQQRQPLTDFQQWLWWLLQRNREAMGWFRLLEDIYSI